jgi:4-amino-4-deoxy-L-arabinose transferase-like glycosyltransferase
MTIEQSGMQNVRCQSLSTWLRDHAHLATLIVLIASLVPRLFLTMSADLEELKTPDSPTYFAPAANLLEHGAFLNGKQKPEVSRTPGYPVFLLAIMVATGKNLDGEDLRTVLVVQTVITSWSVVLLYWLARRILPPVVAFTGCLLAAFSPWGAVQSGFAMTEGLYLLNLALLFLVMYLVVERTTKHSAALVGGIFIGLLTSAAVLVRPIWPLVILVAIALFLLCGDQRKRAWVLVAVMLVSAASPLYLWKARNQREAQFDGLSTKPGENALIYFASSVKAQLKGAKEDRWAIREVAREEERQWKQGLTIQEINDERWRRANAFFREHPILTAYTFALNAGEAIIHPNPSILKPAGLNFPGDTWVLGGLWVAFLILAGVGLYSILNGDRDFDMIQRKWLVALLGICLLLTFASGIIFGAGSRFRAPMELIVPLLAGIGLMRLIPMLRQN